MLIFSQNMANIYFVRHYRKESIEMKFQDFSDDWTESTHRKLIDSSVYDTFTAIIPTVRKYCKENENANY